MTIGGVVFTFVASGATGNQVNVGPNFGASISNLVAVLQASADPTVSKNNYASRSSNYDVSYALDVWSKTLGPAGAGAGVACSTAGSIINGTPVLQVPGLVVLCYGINDVRTGTTTQAQLVALITKAVNRIRAVLPACDIVLWGPNSFLADDPTGSALVSPAIAVAAQAYSTLLYGAYEQLKNVWPNVLVLQKQDIFGKTCQTYAALGGSGLSAMSDQLHPSLGAQTQMADWLAPQIGFKKPFNAQRANLARVGNPTAPYTIYPREVEDPAFYDVIAQANWLGQGNASGNDYMDFLFPGALQGNPARRHGSDGHGWCGLSNPLDRRHALQAQHHDHALRLHRHRPAADFLGRRGHGLSAEVRMGRDDPELCAAAHGEGRGASMSTLGYPDPSPDEQFYARALGILVGPSRRVAVAMRICNVIYWLAVIGALAWLFSQVVDRAPPVTIRSAHLLSADVAAGDPVRVEYDVRRWRTCQTDVSWAIFDGLEEVHRFGPVHIEATGYPGSETLVHAWPTPTNAAPGSGRLRVTLSFECPGNYLQAVYPVVLVLADVGFLISDHHRN